MQRLEARSMTVRLGLAVLLAAAGANATGVSVETASKSQLKEAKEPFVAGMAAMEAQKFEEAAKNFQASYDIVASPNSRLMLARALVQLGRLAEAYRELEGVIAEVNTLAQEEKKYRSTADSAQTELDDLKPKLAFVTVQAGTKVTIGNQAVSFSDWGKPLPVAPGTVAVVLSSSDGNQHTEQLTLKPGETRELKAEVVSPPCPEPVAPPPSPPPPPPPPPEHATLNQSTVGYVVGAVGVVGLGAYFGLIYGLRGKESELTQDCSGGDCPESAISDGQTRGALSGLGYAGLGLGIVGLGVGAVLVLTDTPPDTQNQAQAALRIGPGSVELRGRF
jgi:hypothetical protein